MAWPAGESLELLGLLVPLKVYINAFSQKKEVIKDNLNKSGIYRWINIINGSSYVGSSVNLGKRFGQYFSPGFLKTKTSSQRSKIYNALLKNGTSNFRLEILEYCDKEFCIERENFYLVLLKPLYNISETATRAAMLNRKHSLKSLLKISEAKKGINNPMYGKLGKKVLGTGKTFQRGTY